MKKISLCIAILTCLVAKGQTGATVSNSCISNSGNIIVFANYEGFKYQR
jgi:hypothetical protein